MNEDLLEKLDLLIAKIEALTKKNEKLHKELKKLYSENSRLKRDVDYYRGIVEELKNTLRMKNVEVKEMFSEVEKYINRMRSQVIKAILELTQKYGRPPHYNDIARWITNRNPHVSIETINRCCRKMKEEGILFSPAKGRYYINTEALKELKKKGIIKFF